MSKKKHTSSLHNGIKESARTKNPLSFGNIDFGCGEELKDLREQANGLVKLTMIFIHVIVMFSTFGFFVSVAFTADFFEGTFSNWASLLCSYACIFYLWRFKEPKRQKELDKIWWKIALFCVVFSLPVMSFRWSFVTLLAFSINILMVSSCILLSNLRAKTKDTVPALKLKMLIVWIFMSALCAILVWLKG